MANHRTTNSIWLLATLICSTGFWASEAEAQSKSPAQIIAEQTAQEDIIDQFRGVGSSGPQDKDGHGATGEHGITSALQISATDGNAFLDFSVALVKGKVNPQDLKNGNYEIGTSNDQFSLNVNVPINKNDSGNFADLKKIGNDAKLKLSYTHFSSSRLTGKGVYANYARFARTCLIEIGKKWLSDQFPAATPAHQIEASALVKRYDTEIGQPLMDWNSAVRAASNTELAPNFGPVAFASCSIGEAVASNEALEAQYSSKTFSPAELKSYRDAVVERRKLTFWGFSGNAGYQKHDILNRTAFQLDTVDRVGFDATAYFGQIMKSNKLSWRLSAGYSRGYESATAIDFCRPVGGDQECINGQDGLPVKKNTAYGKAEARIVVLQDDAGRPKVAFAPEVTYDVKGNDWSFDLPIYLQRNEKKGLDGGIRIGYQTKDDDFGLGVFVGIPFSNWF